MRFATSVGVASLLVTRVLGHPTASQHAQSRRGVDISAFRLKGQSSYADVAKTGELNLPPSFGEASYTDTASAVVKELFPKAEFRLVPDHYIGNDGIGHVVFKQQIHGIDIDNADFNVNVSIVEGTQIIEI